MTPDQPTVLDAAIEDDKLDMHTLLPATVEKFDKDKRTVDLILGVAQVIRKKSGEGFDVVEYPKLQNVRVLYPKTKKFAIYFPLEEGDTGCAFFMESSIAQWRAGAATKTPEDFGRFNMSSCVFLPGFDKDGDDFSSPVDGAMVIGQKTGSYVAWKDDGDVIVNVQGSKKLLLGAADAGESFIKGDTFKAWLEGLLGDLLGHTHPGAYPVSASVELASSIPASIADLVNSLSTQIKGK